MLHFNFLPTNFVTIQVLCENLVKNLLNFSTQYHDFAGLFQENHSLLVNFKKQKKIYQLE